VPRAGGQTVGRGAVVIRPAGQNPNSARNRPTLAQGIIKEYALDTYLLTWIEAFLFDRKAQNLAKGTLDFYRRHLNLFIKFCDSQVVTQIDQLDPRLLRQYMIWLEEKGHNPGGISAAYRSLRAFLFWWEDEVEPEDWKNPIRKVKAPKVALESLEPVPLDTVKALSESCLKNTFTGIRDRGIFLTLLDTGARAGEFLSINLEDINPITGEILIRQGKGRKPRTVFIGQKSRKAIRQYLRLRISYLSALWVTNDQTERLTYNGLKSMVVRRSRSAGVKTPALHAFRRQFALSCLRSGMNVYYLQNLMGHSDLQVLNRYLKQTTKDVSDAHRQAGPVDNSL
jgi:site-specific recombinase XerD